MSYSSKDKVRLKDLILPPGSAESWTWTLMGRSLPSPDPLGILLQLQGHGECQQFCLNFNLTTSNSECFWPVKAHNEHLPSLGCFSEARALPSILSLRAHALNSPGNTQGFYESSSFSLLSTLKELSHHFELRTEDGFFNVYVALRLLMLPHTNTVLRGNERNCMIYVCRSQVGQWAEKVSFFSYQLAKLADPPNRSSLIFGHFL